MPHRCEGVKKRIRETLAFFRREKEHAPRTEVKRVIIGHSGPKRDATRRNVTQNTTQTQRDVTQRGVATPTVRRECAIHPMAGSLSLAVCDKC